MDEPSSDKGTNPRGGAVAIPCNEAHSRVGDTVLHAPYNGMRRGIAPQAIIREIVAAHGFRLRTQCLLDSVEYVLSVADLSVAYPAFEVPRRLGTALNMVKDEKPLHSRAFDEKVTLDPCP